MVNTDEGGYIRIRLTYLFQTALIGPRQSPDVICIASYQGIVIAAAVNETGTASNRESKLVIPRVTEQCIHCSINFKYIVSCSAINAAGVSVVNVKCVNLITALEDLNIGKGIHIHFAIGHP